MCLYPKLILNKKYLANKKNGGKPPEIKDARTGWVPVGCGKCIECKKRKAREWSVRLQEEIRTNTDGQFVTLTFSNESIRQLIRDLPKDLKGYALDNELATLATRRFLERWRKKHKKSVKHWLVTELGHEGTENIHLHGILFTKHKDDISTIWQYGFVYVGDYVNEATVNYCCKYAQQTDPIHKEYSQKILTSPGIGADYIKRHDAKTNKFKGVQTDEQYTTRQGSVMALPIYYRNKIYTEEEREQLWIQKLDKEERYILGNKVSTKDGPETYYRELKHARKKNKILGYGTDETNWSQKAYEEARREINLQKRLDNFNEKY